MRTEDIKGLVGRSFHVFGDGGVIEMQGTVVAPVGSDHYLVRYYDMIMGEESTMEIISTKDMATSPQTSRMSGSWQFYVDDEHMREWYEHKGKYIKSSN